MKSARWIFLLLLASAGAHAQETKIDRIDIVDYGIYTADKVSVQRDDKGIEHTIVNNVKHAVTTSTVAAQIGVQFGIRFRVAGSPDGAAVTLKKVLIFPPAGLHPPGAAQPRLRVERERSAKIGALDTTSYSIDEEWERVPGPWTFQLWDGGRKLAEKTFTVVEK